MEYVKVELEEASSIGGTIYQECSSLHHYQHLWHQHSLLWSCPVHCRVFSSLSGLYSLAASSTIAVTNRNISSCYKKGRATTAPN
jgi:hypothetical protein